MFRQAHNHKRIAALNQQLRLALIGAGVMGHQRYQHLRSLPQAQLCAVADPGPQAAAFAAGCGVPYFAGHRQILEQAQAQAVMVANLNDLHVSTALDRITAGVPLPLEKPVGVHLDEVRELVAASGASRVPMLVGHHRRRNPLIAWAREVPGSGALSLLRG